MQIMYANEYAKYSGYPLLTIKNFCKEGILPHDLNGRKYLINVAMADEVLKKRMLENQKVNEQNDKVVNFKPKQSAKAFDFLSELNKLQRQG